jgi:hypothetical protein
MGQGLGLRVTGIEVTQDIPNERQVNFQATTENCRK